MMGKKKDHLESSPKQDSRTADFILQLYLIITGIAFGFSIENLFSAEITPASFTRFITVVVLLTIWLHGQVGYGLSETYDQGSGWFGRVVENYIEIGGAILVMTAAMVQNNEILFYWIVFGSYAFDLGLETVYILRLSPVKQKYEREYEVARSWLWVDLAAVFLIGLLLVLRLSTGSLNVTAASIGLLLIVIALSLWDYSYNRDFYFGLEAPSSPKVKRSS